ncbi:Ig-like domain-containing protein [Haloferax chudinovii]|uniref:Ig-like domain-containing protein n=1 Tax=Haloferax chudinovii TaxID=1109010 RepID=A0ABD5XEX9_9EURY
MRRRSIVLFALFASMLVVSAAPASAADGDLVVGSEHTTGSDFTSGTLTNVSVSGSGESASVVLEPTVTTLLEDWDDGSLADYSGDTGSASISTVSHDGPNSLRLESSYSNVYIYNTSSAVEPGDTFSTWVRPGSEGGRHGWVVFGDPTADGSSDSARDGYQAYIDADNEIRLQRVDNGSVTQLKSATPTINADNWYRLKVDWGADGTIVMSVYDDTGTLIDTISETDTTFQSSSFVGYGIYNGYANYDTLQISNEYTGGSYLSATHGVSDPPEGRVDLTLDNATADVTWQANTAGTWTNVSSATFSTGGTKTADLSSTSADQWRVRVDFETTGADPTAELGRDAVYFPVSTPTLDATSASPTGGEVVHNSQPTLSIDVSDDDLSTAQGDQLTLTWRVNGTVVDTTTRSTNGAASIIAPSLSDGNHTWSVTVDDSYGETVTSTSFSFEVDHFEPTITNLEPPDDTSLSTRDITLSANLTDSDFAYEGDELTAEFIVDGNVVGSEVLTSNGTASTMFSMDGGSASWSVRVSDTYGNTVISDNRTIRSPSTLTIRNVSTGEPITGSAQVTAKLYSGELIFTKNTSDGTIDLTGVPVERGYIIEVTVDGYVTRTVAIESVFEQGDVYLLPETADAVYQEMTLNDQTGDFEASSTVLYIERPIERNGTIEWRVVTGDYFGADSVFKTTLEKDQRYRLVIENDDGDRRELGAYIAAVNGTAPLDVGTIQWQAPKGDSYQWDAVVDDEMSALRVMFSDPEDETTDFDIVVHERGNASNVLFESSATNLSSFQRTEPLSQSELEQDWAVNITLERNSQTITIDEPISSAASIRTTVPIDTRWATLAGLVLLVALAAAFPSTLSRVGAVAVVSVATGITWLGWVDIPMSVIGLSGAVALLGLAASFNSYS